MKKSLLLLLLCAACLGARSQTFTVVNNSKSMLYFDLAGSDLNSCNQKYHSMVMIYPSSTIVYGSPSEVKWTGEAPAAALEYCSFSANYTDPSGACVSRASNSIGSSKCRLAKEATINAAKCSGGSGTLNLSWVSKNGNVLVTIN